MTGVTQQQIMYDLVDILGHFNGRDYGGQITTRTMFSRDLGMASIDAVVLGEVLEEHCRRKLPFNEFLAEVGRRAGRDVEVGELAEFLVKYLATE